MDEIGEVSDYGSELRSLRWPTSPRRGPPSTSPATAQKTAATIYTLRATTIGSARYPTATIHQSQAVRRPKNADESQRGAEAKAAPLGRR
jgi:hypothetical protein